MESNEWKEYRFSELVEIIGGGTPKTNVEKYWNGDIPWLSVKDFNSDNRKIYYTEKTITKEGLKNSSTNLLEEGDLIISARGTVGALAQLGRPMAFNQSCYGLKAKKITSNDFIYYLLKYKIREIKQNIHGSVFDTITRNTFDVLTAKIPNIKEQKAIANILSTLDEKIETNNQINEKLEEMAQALFKHWFVDFEFPNENGEPYKSSGGEMVESELGMIPKGWEVGKLGELVEISNKSIKPQEYPEKFFEHYSIPAFDNGRTPEIQKGEEIKSSKYVINNHMVLVSKLNPSTKRIWKPITQTNNAICSTEFIVYMAKKENILSYVFEFLNNEKFQGILTANATGSTGSRQRVKPKETLNYKVVLPPLKLMRQFSKIIEPMHLKIGSNMIENQKLKGLRDILLPKLMSGEIRVPLDDEVLSEQN
ncbi:restriction endonuclease subunit S [Aeribacillus sp. FSL K6-8394]|uniref:restriction endonuclease subunit S n=1 Tax=Aeribacillus sp. FSL K6-8394 TaxID=2954570 RepID=UPI0030FA3486